MKVNIESNIILFLSYIFLENSCGRWIGWVSPF